MNTAVTWSDELAGTVADERSSAVRRAFVLSGLILAFTVGLSAWMYLYEKQHLQERAAQVQQHGVQTPDPTFDMLRRVDRLALSVMRLARAAGQGPLAPRGRMPPSG